MDHTQILLRPVVTEKATFLRDGANQVAFFVHPDANKIEIKKAVETAFNVKVTDVNVVTRKPTERRPYLEAVHAARPGPRHQHPQAYQSHYRDTRRRAGISHGSESSSVRIPAWV